MEHVEKYLIKRLKKTNLDPVDRQTIEGLLVVTKAYNSEKVLKQPKLISIIGPHTPDQLAQAVNETCGCQLPDRATLSSLYYFEERRAGEEVPEKWVQCLQELSVQERSRVRYPIGAAMRGYIMNEGGRPSYIETLGDLRATSLDDLITIRQIGPKFATFLITIFKRQESLD